MDRSLYGYAGRQWLVILINHDYRKPEKKQAEQK